MAYFYKEPSHTFSEYLLIPGYTSEECVPDRVSLRTLLTKYRKGHEGELNIDFDFIKYKRGMKLGSMANCVLGKTRTVWRLWICGGVL